MQRNHLLLIIFYCVIFVGCTTLINLSSKTAIDLPKELVSFVPYQSNPIFSGTGEDTWDKQIRERGYIIKEGNTYHMWYTGYSPKNIAKFLGYATSEDGIKWTRYNDKPIYSANWVEDMFVVESKGKYYMFAEGRGDSAHMLISSDKIHWEERGILDIRQTNGNPISKGAFGTPTVIIENGIWYLFYEREDRGVWLATSNDQKKWVNVQDQPVLSMGSETYDQFGIAMNQVIKYKGKYYGYYHGTGFKDWHEWSTNVAVSYDLIHWKKYGGNPIVQNNQSSGILVNDGNQFRLYTMHRMVNLYFPENNSIDKK